MLESDFRIIVIDDNPAIHRDFIKILTSQAVSEFDKLSIKLFGEKHDDISLPEFKIDAAFQGQEGATLVQKAVNENNPYSLAFVDIRMPPGWDGIETIKHIWEIDKDIQIVICTAYSDYSWEETVANLGKTDNLLILKKPFDHVAVRQLACALTKKWQLLQETRRYTTNLKKEVENRTFSLQKSLSLVKATLESSKDGILVINNEGKIVDYNKKFISMWEIPQSILETKNEWRVIGHMQNLLVDADDFFTKMKELHTHEDAASIDVIKLIDGRILECFSQPQKLDDHTVGRVLNFHDITKRAKLEEELHHQATHDSLTGLPNRIFLLSKVKEAIKRSEENHSHFALAFLDLDRFKLINDSLSHAMGDELLRLTATRLQKALQPTDTLARLGGDEFVIVMSDLNKPEDILPQAYKFLKLFKKPFNIAGREVTITASIGVSLFPKDGITIDVLLKNADSAMYKAKELGANNFQLYLPEMNAHTLEQLDQEMNLRHAIKNGELFLCYQPQFDLTAEKLVAVEALVRWQHPKKGMLLPIDFIPLAEQTGLILEIGEWVLHTACAQNKAWQDEGLPPIRVAVNVTAQQFRQQNLVEVVKKVLRDTGLKPQYLEIELTENVIISSMEIMKTVTALKELGINIAIDDFGTGYSSLSYLKKIPLDRLKIDSSFIQHIQSKNDDEVIIRAIIAMAKNLELEVLAEGVETENQLNFLKSNQCEEIQGFYYSKPLTAFELKILLKNPAKIINNVLKEER